MKHLLTLHQKIIGFSSILSSVIIIFMMFLVVIDVILRTLNIPIYGVNDAQGFLVGAAIYLGLAKALEKKQHINVDIINQIIPKKIVNKIEIPTNIVSFVFFSWFTYLATINAYTSTINKEKISGAVQFPVYPLKIIIAFGVLMLTIQIIIDLIFVIQKIRLDRNQEDDVSSSEVT